MMFSLIREKQFKATPMVDQRRVNVGKSVEYLINILCDEREFYYDGDIRVRFMIGISSHDRAESWYAESQLSAALPFFLLLFNIINKV